MSTLVECNPYCNKYSQVIYNLANMQGFNILNLQMYARLLVFKIMFPYFWSQSNTFNTYLILISCL